MKQKFLFCAVAVALVAVGCSTQDPSNAAAPAAAEAPVAAASEAPPAVAVPSPAPVAVAPPAPAMPNAAESKPATAPAAGNTVETAARINVAEAARLVASGSAVIVDVRDEASFKTSRAKGAIHIPYAEIGKRMAELPMGKTVIAYCT